MDFSVDTAPALARACRHAGAAGENARQTLAASSLLTLLGDAGYAIEGPGDRDDEQLAGRYWWTLLRERWSGIECGDDFATHAQAVGDAVAAMLLDEDLDWPLAEVAPDGAEQFPAEFAHRMGAAVKAV